LQNNENNKVILNIDINKISEFMNEFINMKMHVSNIEKELNKTKEELNEKLNKTKEELNEKLIKTNVELNKEKIKNEQLSNKILNIENHFALVYNHSALYQTSRDIGKSIFHYIYKHFKIG